MPRTQFFSVPRAVAVRRERQKTAAVAAVHAAAAVVVLKLPGAAVGEVPAPARERVINGLFPLWLRWKAFLFQSSTAKVHSLHKNTFRLA